MVYRVYKITAYGIFSGQKAGKKQEMVDMFTLAWAGGVKSREEKVSLHGGSLWTQGGTLTRFGARVVPTRSGKRCPVASVSGLYWCISLQRR